MINENKNEFELAEEEEEKGHIRTHEQDILKGLLTAAAFKTEEDNIHPVEVVRNDVVLFTFRIRPLDEKEYHECKEKNTKYVRNRNLGIRFPEDTDSVRYRSALIYQATVDEDRTKVWDNKDAWHALKVLSGVDLIDKILLAGEKDAILDRIDQISGYKSTVVAEETAKK